MSAHMIRNTQGQPPKQRPVIPTYPSQIAPPCRRERTAPIPAHLRLDVGEYSWRRALVEAAIGIIVIVVLWAAWVMLPR